MRDFLILLFVLALVSPALSADYNRASPQMACEAGMAPYEAVAAEHHLQRVDLSADDSKRFVDKFNAVEPKTAYEAESVTFFFDRARAFTIFAKPGEACIFKAVVPVAAVNVMLEAAGIVVRIGGDGV